MRLLAAMVFVATPLAAQSARDTAEIRDAATTQHRHERASFPYFVTHREQAFVKRFVADTAWVTVVDPLAPPIDYPSVGASDAGTGGRAKMVRVERRAGKWVRMTPPRVANPRLRD